MYVSLYMDQETKLKYPPRTNETAPHDLGHMVVSLQTLACGCCPQQKISKEKPGPLGVPSCPSSFPLSFPAVALGFLSSLPRGEQVGEPGLAGWVRSLCHSQLMHEVCIWVSDSGINHWLFPWEASA